MTQNEEAHSDIVGGSTAARRMACPGSYQMEKRLPSSIKEESSSYADEGTALHAAMAYILTNNVIDLDTILGMEFEGYVITNEMMKEAIEPCVDFFDALCDDLERQDGDAPEFLVEQRCQMPGIPGAFGTSDLIFRTPKRSGIVDWKFGVGVPVKAYYNDPDTGAITPNAQLMFYARAAMHTYPHMFEVDNKRWSVELHIVQPRVRDGETHSERNVDVGDLLTFRDDLVRAVSEAQGKDPTIKRGDHCRFAKCKTICPKFTGPSVYMAKLSGKLAERKKGPLGGIDIDWAVAYGELLQLAEIAEMFVNEARTQAHAWLEQGHPITDEAGNPLYKLVPKRGVEKYTDEVGAVRMAMDTFGLTAQEVQTAPQTKSPAQLRAALAEKIPGSSKKAREEKAKEMLRDFTANVSSGTTLAPYDDKRQGVIATAATIARIGEKLAALTGR